MEKYSSPGQATLHVIQYLLPLLIFGYYAFASLISVCIQRKPAATGKSQARDTLYRCVAGLTGGVLLTYVIESITFIIIGLQDDEKSFSKSTLIYLILSSFAWFVLLAGLYDAPPPIRYPFIGSWMISLVLGIIIFSMTLIVESPTRKIKYTRLVLGLCRLLCLGLLNGFTISRLIPKKPKATANEESQPLLQPIASHNDSAFAGGYGGVNDDSGGKSPTEDADVEKDADGSRNNEDEDEDPEEKLRRTGNWWNYTRTFAVYIPIVWPKGKIGQQLRIFGCFLCLGAGRVLNILKPRQSGLVVNSLSDPRVQETGWVWPILLLAIYSLLSSSAGVPLIRSYLWLPVEQKIRERLLGRSYNHVMNLSCDFHDSKRSGPLWYSIYNARSVTNMLDLVCFRVLPVLFDFVLAACYIYFEFDAYLALIVFGTSILYVWSSTALVRRENAIHRRFRDAWKNEQSVLTETTQNWKTVSYFNRIPYEQRRYAEALASITRENITWHLVTYFEHAIKSCIMEVGLFLILVITGYRVAHGAPIGDVVTLMFFWGQINYPLSVMANSFNQFVSVLVDAEDLLKILNTPPSITNRSNAKPLDLQSGEVEFNSVCFSYGQKRAGVLKDVSFRCTPGQTVALVGETGGGKSTILKLLFRFYDVDSGCVKIDGQDIRDVTLESLRSVIGNVPQDATLFNETIIDNVRYAKPEATDEEIYKACKAAAIHDKILSFPKDYQTVVGEGGTKLSGGELQRIAIARVLLQNPSIVLLDEATSSVDSATEEQIQKSLKKLTQGRTTFIIAHRLSTIVHSDLILVVHKGEIVERGTHKKLMAVEGRYHNLWFKQMLPKAEEVAQSAARSRPEQQSSSGYVNDLNENVLTVVPKKSTRDSGDASPDESVQSESYPGSRNLVSPIESDPPSKKKWRPDAPEFIPQSLRSIATQGSHDEKAKNEDTSTRSIENLKSSSENKRNQKTPNVQDAPVTSHAMSHDRQGDRKGMKRNPSGAPKSTQDQGSQSRPRPAANETREVRSRPSHKSTPTQEEEGSPEIQKQKRRRLDLHRRKQSKSEPGSHAQTDGTKDESIPTSTGGGSGEDRHAPQIVGHGTSQPNHAPILSAQTEEVGQTGGAEEAGGRRFSRRSRRRRHKSRNVNSSQNSSSATNVGSTAMAWPKLQMPAAPPTSPAQEGAT